MAASKDLTYFTENKKMIEDKRRSTADIPTDPYLRCLVGLLQNSPRNPSDSDHKLCFSLFFQGNLHFPRTLNLSCYGLFLLLLFKLKTFQQSTMLCLTVGCCYSAFLRICTSLVEKPVATLLAPTQALVIVKSRRL